MSTLYMLAADLSRTVLLDTSFYWRQRLNLLLAPFRGYNLKAGLLDCRAFRGGQLSHSTVNLVWDYKFDYRRLTFARLS